MSAIVISIFSNIMLLVALATIRFDDTPNVRTC